MSMSPLGKMSLESFGSLVDKIAANLTCVANVQTMQLVQPVGNGLAIPAQGEVLWIVWNLRIKNIKYIL